MDVQRTYVVDLERQRIHREAGDFLRVTEVLDPGSDLVFAEDFERQPALLRPDGGPGRRLDALDHRPQAYVAGFETGRAYTLTVGDAVDDEGDLDLCRLDARGQVDAVHRIEEGSSERVAALACCRAPQPRVVVLYDGFEGQRRLATFTPSLELVSTRPVPRASALVDRSGEVLLVVSTHAELRAAPIDALPEFRPEELQPLAPSGLGSSCSYGLLARCDRTEAELRSMPTSKVDGYIARAVETEDARRLIALRDAILRFDPDGARRARVDAALDARFEDDPWWRAVRAIDAEHRNELAAARRLLEGTDLSGLPDKVQQHALHLLALEAAERGEFAQANSHLDAALELDGRCDLRTVEHIVRPLPDDLDGAPWRDPDPTPIRQIARAGWIALRALLAGDAATAVAAMDQARVWRTMDPVSAALLAQACLAADDGTPEASLRARRAALRALYLPRDFGSNRLLLGIIGADALAHARAELEAWLAET